MPLTNVSGVILAAYLIGLELPRDRYTASLTAVQVIHHV